VEQAQASKLSDFQLAWRLGGGLVVAVLAAVMVWIVSVPVLGPFFQIEYCIANFMPQGDQLTAGPRFSSPISIECQYQGLGWVSETDARPLGYALSLFGSGGIIVGSILHFLLLRFRCSNFRKMMLAEKAGRLILAVISVFALVPIVFLLAEWSSAAAGDRTSIPALLLYVVPFVVGLFLVGIEFYWVLLRPPSSRG
jgi:phosphotransferase system  glucose/maltose/N-acetylglucosamine-specific IIC component